MSNKKNGNRKRPVHHLVRINYLPRIVGFSLFGVIFASVFYPKENWWLVSAALTQGLLWPHIAYLLGRYAKKPYQTEMRNFWIEAVLSGIWTTLASFSLWPCSIMVISGFANNIATGGPKLLRYSFLYYIGGIGIGGLFAGFSFSPESSWFTAYASVTFLLIYVTLMAYQSYRNAKLLVESKVNLKSAHQEIKRKFDEARVEIEERKRISEELMRANIDLKQFAHSVSHDLKAPLRGMASIIYFIEQDLSPGSKVQTQEHFAHLNGRVKRLEKLISGILDYTKIGNTTATQTLDMNHCIREVMKDLTIPENFDIRIEPGFPKVEFNDIQMTKIYSNLISNAIKYNNKEKGLIETGYLEREHDHEFFVRDNGPGIEKKYHDRIFGMFQKLHPRDEIEGSGIGLSIVKKIIDQNDGKIWIESDPGQGTTFRFTLPKKMKPSVMANLEA